MIDDNILKHKTEKTIVELMTKHQRIKYFGASDPDKKKKRSTEERVNEFLEQDSINALGVAMHYDAIILLYEDNKHSM